MSSWDKIATTSELVLPAGAGVEAVVTKPPFATGGASELSVCSAAAAGASASAAGAWVPSGSGGASSSVEAGSQADGAIGNGCGRNEPQNWPGAVRHHACDAASAEVHLAECFHFNMRLTRSRD